MQTPLELFRASKIGEVREVKGRHPGMEGRLLLSLALAAATDTSESAQRVHVFQTHGGVRETSAGTTVNLQ